MRALYEHCERVYSKMLEEATPDPTTGIMVWEGHLTKLFKDLGLSTPYYTSVTQQLRRMDCIRQQRRGGGGGGLSQWLLIQTPTPELFEIKGNELKPTANEILQQQIKDLNGRLIDLEARVERLELNANLGRSEEMPQV